MDMATVNLAPTISALGAHAALSMVHLLKVVMWRPKGCYTHVKFMVRENARLAGPTVVR